ncbi:MAG: hypothetical protein GVY36_03865 [Verrucomicrobia bacterium]|nr:hypothetical protein [Verrucomicrobiota bacterium]
MPRTKINEASTTVPLIISQPEGVEVSAARSNILKSLKVRLPIRGTIGPEPADTKIVGPHKISHRLKAEPTLRVWLGIDHAEQSEREGVRLRGSISAIS